MFRIFRSVRLVLAAIVLIPMGLFMAWTAAFGAGHAVLVAPQEGALSVSVDGAAAITVAQGTHQQLTLDQGRHTLKISGPGGAAERALEVKSGFATLLVPGDDQQCFVLLDVSKSHYSFGSKKSEEHPRLTRRVKGTEVYDLPGSTYYSEDELPRSIKENSSANLLLETDCATLSQSDGELLKALGL